MSRASARPTPPLSHPVLDTAKRAMLDARPRAFQKGAGVDPWLTSARARPNWFPSQDSPQQEEEQDVRTFHHVFPRLSVPDHCRYVLNSGTRAAVGGRGGCAEEGRDGRSALWPGRSLARAAPGPCTGRALRGGIRGCTAPRLQPRGVVMGLRRWPKPVPAPVCETLAWLLPRAVLVLASWATSRFLGKSASATVLRASLAEQPSSSQSDLPDAAAGIEQRARAVPGSGT